MTARTPRAGTPRPPRWARWLLRRSLPPAYREQQIGDLEEEFQGRARQSGAARARRWYARQALGSLGPSLMVRLRDPLPREEHRVRSGVAPGEGLVQDVRYGLRSLVKNPTFAFVSTATLALAIGVNTAIFSLVSVVVFADLPMGEPETMTLIRGGHPSLGEQESPLSIPDFLDLREQSRSFAAMTAMQETRWVLTGDGPPARIEGMRITANLMDVWQLAPARGRSFTEDEARPGGPDVVMLSHGFWRRHYGASPDAVGSRLELDGEEHTVVGVVSPDMEFADLADAEVWAPLQISRESASREERSLLVAARLAPGVSPRRAADEIARLGEGLRKAYAENRDWTYRSILVEESLLDEEAKLILVLLVLSVSFVLLIACANVANMLLARATTRAREMAVRSALGARRIRLVRQLLTESFLISALSAVLGLALARGLLAVLRAITAGQEQLFTMAQLDRHVLGFTLVVTVMAPMAFGLLPALRTSGNDVASSIKDGSPRSGDGRRSSRTRNLLAAGQVALALMAMIMSGLLVRTVVAIEQRAWGMEIDRVMTVQLQLPEAGYEDDADIRLFFDEAVRRTRGVAGVETSALASGRPSVEFTPYRIFDIEGRESGDDDERPTALRYVVTPGLLDLFGIPLVSGRDIAVQDGPEAPRVALVSAEAVERFFGGSDPIGKRIRLGTGPDAEWHEIVGVVADVRPFDDAPEPNPTLYLPFAQDPSRDMVLFARAGGDPTGVAGALANAIWDIDPNLPLEDSRTMERAYKDESATGYALLTLFVTFAVFALIMAAIGIYGVMSYAVSQRTSEISIRLALGAEIGRVRRMVLWQGGRIVLAGSALGLVGALFLSRLVRSIVYGISPVDPVTFVVVPALLISVALAANYVPARRATRIEPMGALRVE